MAITKDGESPHSVQRDTKDDSALLDTAGRRRSGSDEVESDEYCDRDVPALPHAVQQDPQDLDRIWCPICGSDEEQIHIRSKRYCSNCHALLETCCD